MQDSRGSPLRGRNDGAFRITKTLGRFILFPFFRIETQGRENVPLQSSFVLLPKHQRWEDVPLIALASPTPLYYIAKSELFRNPMIRWVIKSLGGIPLNRRRPVESRKSLQLVMELLKNSEGVVIFPEGTYYRNRMGPGRQGIVRMILSRVPVPFVPVGIQYRKSGWRTQVRIEFGKAIHGDAAASASAFFDHIMEEISRLSGLMKP
jgi:1-acyl-sn-glycerol-3-phosphate acyltransferase